MHADFLTLNEWCSPSNHYKAVPLGSVSGTVLRIDWIDPVSEEGKEEIHVMEVKQPEDYDNKKQSDNQYINLPPGIERQWINRQKYCNEINQNMIPVVLRIFNRNDFRIILPSGIPDPYPKEEIWNYNKSSAYEERIRSSIIREPRIAHKRNSGQKLASTMPKRAKPNPGLAIVFTLFFSKHQSFRWPWWMKTSQYTTDAS